MRTDGLPIADCGSRNRLDPRNLIGEAFRTWVKEQCRILWGEAPEKWKPLVADGSNRQFFRVRTSGRSLVALCHPEGTPGNTSENDAYWSIGRHLRDRSVPVPALHAYQPEEGWIILEDLGDLSLQDAVKSVVDSPPQVPPSHLTGKSPSIPSPLTGEGEGGGDPGRRASQAAILSLYEAVLDALLTLQLHGRKGFQDAWCYQSPRYDENLMLSRESGYFFEAFLRGYLPSVPQFPPPGGGESKGEGSMGMHNEQTLLQEFRALAHLASRAPTHFLTHRDFQSRNILLPSPGQPHIIDFQGARWGPLQYDVAALTIDPYVDLGPETRDGILKAYLQRLEDSDVISADAFMEHYPVIALHRNLQILGAFAFLGRVRQKPFFLQWIPRALSHLRALLGSHPEWPCAHLRDEVEKAFLLIQP